MKKLLFCLNLFISQTVLAITFTTYGNTTYGSDGSSFTTYGNTTYVNDGTRYTTYGNTTYGSDGSKFTQYGNTTYVTSRYGTPSYSSSNIIQPTYFSDEPSRQMIRTGQAISQLSDAILQMGIEESRTNSYKSSSKKYIDYSEVINTAYDGDSTGSIAGDSDSMTPQQLSNTVSKNNTKTSLSPQSINENNSQLFDNMIYISDGRTCRKTGGKTYCD
ncbi:MAG: hypothetical protein Q4D61_02610 [Cardiobacteriaceae bacterium]|nr:hypothetical protein [Cardiobacteriaceae bacterium]